MTQKTKQVFTISERRQKVAKLYAQHWDQEKIAEELEVSQPTVSRDIDFLIKQATKGAEEEIKNLITRELLELDFIEKEAAENYEALKPKAGASEYPDDIFKKHRGMRDWQVIRLKAKKRRAELLGLDQPQKIIFEKGDEKDLPKVVFYIPDNGRDPDFINRDKKPDVKKQ